MLNQFDCVIFNVSVKTQAPRSLGAYRIAHVLRSEGWDCEVVDFFDEWQLSELKLFLSARIRPHTRWIGFSYLFVHRNHKADALQQWIKRVFPWITIVVGSGARWPYPSKHVDYNINGFGEVSVLALLKYLYSNGPAPMFGLNTHAGRMIDANVHYPAYPMASLDVAYEARDFLDPAEWLGMEFARGCMFKCAFCNFPVLGVRGDHSRTAEDFRTQLMRTHDEWGITNYFVADETFNDRTEKIAKFADVVESVDFDTRFTGFLRGDLAVARPEDREHLLRMGFIGHYYGIESFNVLSARAVGKGMATERLQQGLLDLRNYFLTHGRREYRGTISIIVGLPHDTEQSVREGFEWLETEWSEESTVVYPLEIPIGAVDQPSHFSLNWRDYGYRPSSTDSRDLEDEHYKTRIKMGTQFLNWETDHMNYRRALELAADFEHNRHKGSFRLENWVLANVDLPEDFRTRLSMNWQQWVNRSYSARPLMRTYIDRKMAQF